MKMSYQKFYSNQIHSSSLLCQLSQMWKDQMLCDALIRTGPITTKAHRLVLIAACPMLQSMENAAAGSHLEVRLAADIKQEAVNTFLQYLYEGFMMLTEENCRDVEKVARLLQVDGVIKCCADFYKCYQTKTGVVMQSGGQYKYSFQDLIEFRHVRSSDMLKSSHDRLLKRSSEFSRPVSPGGKRQRMHRPGSPTLEGIGPRSGDLFSMSDSYRAHHSDPFERVPRHGAHKGPGGRPSQPGVIDIVEDSIEIVQSDTVEKDPSRPLEQQRLTSQRSVAISIASQITDNNDLRIVNITGSGGTKDGTGSRPSNTTMTSSSKSQLSSSSHPEHYHQQPSPQSSSVPSPSTSSPRMPSFSRQQEIQQRAQEFSLPNLGPDVELVPVPKPRAPPEGPASAGPIPRQQPFPVSISPVGYPPTSIPPKSFGQSQFPSAAAGSATQIMGSPQSIPSPSSRGPRSQSLSSQSRSDSTERASPANEGGKEQSGRDKPDSSSSAGDGTPDLSIVKIEKSGVKDEDSSGLDMYVDIGENNTMTLHHEPPGEGEEGDRSEEDHDEALEEWAREEMTNNDGSNVSGDPSSFGGSFKDHLKYPLPQQRNPLDIMRRGYSSIQYNSGGLFNTALGHPLSASPDGASLLSNIVDLATPLGSFQDGRGGDEVPMSFLQGVVDDTAGVAMLSSHEVHRLVHNKCGKAKACAHCKIVGQKTECGWHVKAYYCCSVCDLVLCGGKRNCYNLFHEMLEKKNPAINWIRSHKPIL